MRIVFDIETDKLVNPTKIWVIVCKDIDTGITHIFRKVTDDPDETLAFKNFAVGVSCWIGHNVIGFDIPVIRRLIGYDISLDNTFDTLTISKLFNYSREAGHSVESYGEEFKEEKIDFKDFTKHSKELEDYCVRDVDICHRIFNKFSRDAINRLWDITNPRWSRSINCEQRFQTVVNDLHDNGFGFDSSKANKLRDKVCDELKGLDETIKTAFPERLEKIRAFKPQRTKHGTLNRKDFRWVDNGDLSKYSRSNLIVRYNNAPFNPASHKQIINVLHNASWRPTDKTKTHIEAERTFKRRVSGETEEIQHEDRLKHLSKYGWKINEQNISSLPSKEQCRVKLQKEEEDTLKSIIKNILNEKEPRLSDTIIRIQDIIKINNLKEITELLLNLLKRCVKNSKDIVEFVEKESNLWSIIVTPQAIYVDFSASYVTDTWDGLKDLKTKLKSIFHEAPKPARTLAKRILLESRRRTLTEWISLSTDRSGQARIHGEFFGIGAWTHRMAHQNPNTANIPNSTDTQGNVKLLGSEMRSLWIASKGRLLVGVDAESIQLRIFAHYIDDEEFTNALISGRKESKTDPHSINQRVLGNVCKSRDAAKRFIYALLLGAGMSKLAEVLDCSETETKDAYNRLLENYTGFARLKKTIIPKDAKRGYFEGLDGRFVKIKGDGESERKHLAMSGYLQNGEAVIMKHATLLWYDKLREKGIDFKLVDMVHDEWQTECSNDLSIALAIAECQCEALEETGKILKLKCPLKGSYGEQGKWTIGSNWKVTH